MLRKGMLGSAPLTLQEIGDTLQVTRERARQMDADVEMGCVENQEAFRSIAERAYEMVTRSGALLACRSWYPCY